MTTRREIEETLLRGDEIAGIRLDTLEKRQLFAFFLSQSTFPSAPFTDQYIEALKAAYANAAQEAAITSPTPALNIPIGTCRLIRVETRSFGGLNRLDGNTLSLDVHGQGMMIGGYNGKGKTSLASALVWGLTGSRLVSQIGPVESASVPQPLFAPVTANVSESDGAPQAIRSWPPVLAYPRSTRAEDLKGASGAAEVILTFLDDAGKEWSLKRVINAAGTMTFDGLQTLGFTEMLAEIAVLMPNRIPAIRIGEGQSEADALVKLLGLEPLGQLADHVADLHHANKNFSKSPSAADVEKVKKAFEAKIEEVRKKLETIFTSIYANINADDPNGKEAECIRLAEELKKKASESTSKVISEIKAEATYIQVSNALLGVERFVLGTSLPEIDAIKFLSALKDQAATLEVLATKLPEIATKYETARHFRELALSDARLKIKAAAAEWHRKTHGADSPVTDCPLCERDLNGDGHVALAEEIQTLKGHAETARLAFDEICKSLVHDLSQIVEPLSAYRKVRPSSDVRKWVEDELAGWLADHQDLAIALPRARDTAILALRTGMSRLPDTPTAALCQLHGEALPGEDDSIRAAFARAELLIQVGKWWSLAEAKLTEEWEHIIGVPDESGAYPAGGLLAAHASVSVAIAAAAPYREAADLLSIAADNARNWKKLKDEREIRQAIRAAIDDLRKLRSYVANEAKTALNSVSKRAREIFDSIYVADELGAPWASVDSKKSLAVTGQLLGGPTVDARWVANTSWLRAFLWSFYLAFREASLKRMGRNPLPLIVLDDPQVSFDIAHRKRWAKMFSDMQKSGQPHELAQIVVTSYDDHFLDELARQGVVGTRIDVQGIDPELGCLTILSGDALRQAWSSFNDSHTAKAPDSQKKAQDYIHAMRKHVEGVMKLMLRGQGIEPSDKTIGGMTAEFDKRKNISPFNLPNFRGFIDALNNEKDFRGKLNKSSHHEDCKTLDQIDANTVKKIWDDLEFILLDAHRELQIYEAVGTHPIDDLAGPTTAEIPVAFGDELKKLNIPWHGRVAAATDGRITTIQAEGKAKPLNFPNHGVARLTVDHLRPIAKSGDLVIYPQFGDPKDGDLVVVAAGKRLRVGRVHLDSKNSGRLVLAPINSSVASPAPPIILPRAHCVVRKIVAVASCQIPPVGMSGAVDDVIPLAAESDLAPLTGDIGAWIVQGDSANPLALDGQTIFCGKHETTLSGISSTEGKAVVAVLDGPSGEETYFKRLRFSGDLAVLENLNPHHDSPPIIAGFKTECSGLKLKAAAPVIGVRLQE